MTPTIIHPDGTEMGPTELNERSLISIPLVLSVGGAILLAVLWANSINVAVEGVKKDQENDRRTLQRIEASVDRVDRKFDELKDTLRIQPRPPETDYGTPRRFDR